MRIAIIGDIHEDIISLRETFRIINQTQCDEVVCLGDITGFKVNTYSYLDTRNAHECIAMVRANCSAVVIGNNDLYQIRKIPSFTGGFPFPSNWYELDYYEKKALAKENIFLYDDVQLPALITREDRSYLESLPEFIVRRIDDVNILLSHFAYPDMLGLRTYFPKTSGEFLAHLDFIRNQNCQLGFSGHMHFEGVSMCTTHDLYRHDFGKYKMMNHLQWIYGPCVANGPFINGFMIWDTKTEMIESIRISGMTHSNGKSSEYLEAINR